MTNDALEALDDVFLTMCPTFSMNTGEETQQGRITLDQYLKIRAALAPVDVEGLKREADAAYCTALDLADKNCRGAQYKLENGKFSNDDLKWHCQHNERIGYHRGMWRVLKELDYLAARGCFGVPEGWQLVPISPFTEMYNAGNDALKQIFEEDEEGISNKSCLFIYDAMIKAAPKKEGV